jgi:transcriptional regulator with GAF, ATPase, and Fis domain
MKTSPPPNVSPTTFCSTPAWLQNFYSISEATRLRERLCASGLPCQEHPSEQTRSVFVLLGEHSPWQEVCDFLGQCAHRDLRTVCISLFNRPLEHYRIWELLQVGADEVLQWNQLAQPEALLAARVERWSVVHQLMEMPLVRDKLIGNSPCWRRLLRQVVEMAAFGTASVLLLGESGTGKEGLAHLVHDLDQRNNKRDFVVTDCTTISPELAGSEFFGHDKGAFTNAVANRDGAFALADGGTLFLDEIGELPLPLQAELLRAVQEKMYKRVGSNFWRQTDFRLVSATNRDLYTEVQAGRFREDLFFRISTCICRVPPLRERTEDIPLLAEHFLKQTLKTSVTPPFDEPVLNYLRTREYPGNVRELRQVVTRMAYRHAGNGPITVGDLAEQDRPDIGRLRAPWDAPALEAALRVAMTNGAGLKEIKRCVSNKAMNLAIADEGGNLQNAAQRLQVSDRTIQLYHAAVKEGNGQAVDVE